jgi:hypothetical protein
MGGMDWVWRMELTYECAHGQACGDARDGAGADEAYCAADARQGSEDVGGRLAGGVCDGGLWSVNQRNARGGQDGTTMLSVFSRSRLSRKGFVERVDASCCQCWVTLDSYTSPQMCSYKLRQGSRH